MDIEWALSEAAGFDAGFSMSISENVLDSLGNIDILLEAIKNWERLRFENRFPDELKEELRKPETEWHLKKVDDHHFELYPWRSASPLSAIFWRCSRDSQGEPTGTLKTVLRNSL